MKHFSKFCSVILLTSLILISCNPMKKNVKTDIADNVIEFIISESNGEYFLISKEEIFQATSKSDDNGIRQITGFTEYRISSYDVNSGNLVSRVILGDRKDNECTFLGESKGLLWYKSVNPELGFHARDPKTLDVKISQEKIAEVNPFMKDNFSQPEWNSIRNYYGFDIYKQMPMISDNSGFLYYVDPDSWKAEKTSESVKQYDFDKNCLTTSMNIKKDVYLFLQGNPRNHIEYGKNKFEDITFLNGDFILSSVQLKPGTDNNDMSESYDNEINKFRKQVDSAQNIINELSNKNESGKNKIISKSKKMWSERNIESLKKRIKYTEDNKKKVNLSENFSLITPDSCIFVYSQTDVTDQSKVLISKIKMNSDTSVDMVWQTKLENIFSDPRKGLNKSSFETVFSKGDPNLDTKRAALGNGKLIFMAMLRAVCIDIESGKVLWEKEL